MNKQDQTQKSPADRTHDDQLDAEKERQRQVEQKPAGPHPSREQTGIVGPEGTDRVTDPTRRTNHPVRE